MERYVPPHRKTFSNPKSYANIAKQEKINKNIEKEFKKDIKKNGWYFLNKNNILLNQVNNNKKLSTNQRETSYKENYINCINKLSNNWNNFRNKDIELVGDRSEYINYEEEINKIADEDEEIQKLLQEYNETLSEDSDTENEQNRHLIY
tara:strand:+ start:3526 stop:3972 length:447 start_codon:yes stop_codon:yes gene_type:complete